MARIRVTVPAFPDRIRSVLVDYRIGQGGYVTLGETKDPASEWTVPDDSLIHVRARYRTEGGALGQGTESFFNTAAALDNRDAASTLTVPAASAIQTGASVEVTQEVPTGEDPDEWHVEVVQGASAMDTAAEVLDGLHAGFHPPGEPIMLSAWSATHSVATRLVRKEDGARTDWAFLSVPVGVPAVSPTQVHTNDFASGTIGKWGGTSNPASMEISGGDLRHKAIYAGDAGGYAGDATDIFAGDAGLYWPGLYTTDDIVLPHNESIELRFHPVLTSITRPTLYAGDAHQYAGGPPEFATDGTPRDRRAHLHNFTAGVGDEIPLEIDVSVATSATASPTFTDADYVTWRPGLVYHNVNTYSVRFVIRSTYLKLVTIDTLTLWHYIWCKGRPWHSHSDGFELIYENTLAAAAVSVSASIEGAKWDELRVEVVWKNAVAATVVLWARPNSDSTASNYIGPGGAGDQIVLGEGIAQNTIERAVFRIVDPDSASVREVIHEGAESWTTTAIGSGVARSAWLWKDASNAITSIQILTDNGGSALATGSRIQIFGKRHHEA